jgi:photosystem II stability/assembly factor-like uncharacterized protein
MRKILLVLLFVTSFWQVEAQLKISTTANNLCAGTDIPFQITGIPANANVQFQRDGVDFGSLNLGNFTIRGAGAGAYTAKALGKDIKWSRRSPDVDYNALTDVFFVNSKVGYAVGVAATIIKTVDGGNTWKDQVSPKGGRFQSIYFIDELNGWAVGEFGLIIKTKNGGTTWEELSQSNGNSWNSYDDFLNVQFIDSKVGFIFGAYELVLKTIDGGNTWKSSKIYNELTFRTYFVDKNIGWKSDFDGEGIIKKTTDGGTTWTVSYNGNVSDPQKGYIYRAFTSFYFFDSNNGWAVGYNGLMVNTVDGGKTWTNRKGVNDGLTFNKITFTDKNNGFATSYEKDYLQTTDGGKTWVLKSLGINSNPQKSFFTDSNTGIAVGSDGFIIKTVDGGKTWQKIRGNTDNYGAITFLDKNTGYRVGGYGSIEKTVDGGNTWKAQNSNSKSYLDKVQFADANTGWVLPSYSNTLLTTLDGGNTWKNQVLSSPYALQAIKLIDAKNGFAIGNGSRINKTIDAGSTWSQIKVLADTNRVLKSIFFINAKTGWIAGDRGVLLKTIDGGNSWIQSKFDDKYYDIEFESIFFYDDKNGWILSRSSGSYDVILKTVDGGITWKEYPTNFGGSSSIIFTDVKNGWLKDSERGNLFNTVDGGITWDTQSSGTNKYLRSMFFVNAQTGWIVGDGNTILKYEAPLLATSNTITINPKPVIPTLAWNNSDGKLTATTTTTSPQLTWLKGVNELKNITAATYQPTSSGSYSVRVTDGNGCSEISRAVEITILASENPLNASGVSVYPNPSSNGIFKVAYTRFSNEMDATMQVIGLDGLPLNSQKMVRQNNAFEGEINASNLTTGIYLLQIVSGEQKAVVKISIAK